MADFFGWSRSPHESLPSAGAAMEAGSASGPPGAPVVDVPTQPPFLLGTAHCNACRRQAQLWVGHTGSLRSTNACTLRYVRWTRTDA